MPLQCWPEAAVVHYTACLLVCVDHAGSLLNNAPSQSNIMSLGLAKSSVCDRGHDFLSITITR